MTLIATFVPFLRRTREMRYPEFESPPTQLSGITMNSCYSMNCRWYPVEKYDFIVKLLPKINETVLKVKYSRKCNLEQSPLNYLLGKSEANNLSNSREN